MTQAADTTTSLRWPWYAALAMVALTIGLLGVGVVLALQRGGAQRPLALDPRQGWREIAWELPVAPWWPSRAFDCSAAQCGAELTLYLRVKVGFCNCTDGIADDAELERIGDFLLISRQQEPRGEGRPLSAAGLKGRARDYRLVMNGLKERNADSVLVGLNSNCDAVVATGVASGDGRLDASAAERAIAALVESSPVRQWIEQIIRK